MRVRWSCALLVAVAACGSAPATPAVDAGQAVDAGPFFSDGGAYGACRGTSSECECTQDSDCTLTRLPGDILDAGACICDIGCGGEPINTATATKWQTDYGATCLGSNLPLWTDGGGCGVCYWCSCVAWLPSCFNGWCIASQ